MSEFFHMFKTPSISGFLSWHWAMMLLFQKDSELSYLNWFHLGRCLNNCNCLGCWSMINEPFAIWLMLSLSQCSLIPQVCIWKLIGLLTVWSDTSYLERITGERQSPFTMALDNALILPALCPDGKNLSAFVFPMWILESNFFHLEQVLYPVF